MEGRKIGLEQKGGSRHRDWHEKAGVAGKVGGRGPRNGQNRFRMERKETGKKNRERGVGLMRGAPEHQGGGQWLSTGNRTLPRETGLLKTPPLEGNETFSREKFGVQGKGKLNDKRKDFKGKYPARTNR